jgi:hypothetical protein
MVAARESGEWLDQHSFDAALDEAENARRPERNVDFTATTERATIRYGYEDRSAVPQVRHPDLRTHGQGAVGAGETLRVEPLTTCGTAVLELATVP